MSRRPKNPLEWMPLYFRDLRVSETWRGMSHAERGIYIELLGHQWEEGSIPGPIEAVARTLHPASDPEELARVLENFPEEKDGRRRNFRTKKVREEQVGKYRGKVKQAETARCGLLGKGLALGLAQGVEVGSLPSTSTSLSPRVGEGESRGGGTGLPPAVESALEPYVRPARHPESIRATVRMLLNPQALPSFLPEEVALALLEMQASGRPFNAASLARWCANNRDRATGSVPDDDVNDFGRLARKLRTP